MTLCVWHIWPKPKKNGNECFMERLKNWTHLFVTRFSKKIFLQLLCQNSFCKDMIVLRIKQSTFASYMWQYPKGVQYITQTAQKLASHIIYYEPHMWQII